MSTPTDVTTVTYVIPTAINVLTVANDAFLIARRQGFTGTVELPSLRRRARMIVHRIGVLPVRNADLADSYVFPR